MRDAILVTLACGLTLLPAPACDPPSRPPETIAPTQGQDAANIVSEVEALGSDWPESKTRTSELSPIEDLYFDAVIHYLEGGSEPSIAHDPTIIYHAGKLWVSWWESEHGEIDGNTDVAYKTSVDNGLTWQADTDRRFIIKGAAASHDYRVPNCLFAVGETLYSFVTEMTDHDVPLHANLHEYDDDAETWNQVDTGTIPLMLVNTRPYLMDNGSYILAGRRAATAGGGASISCVAISNGADLTSWTTHDIVDTTAQKGVPETCLIVDGHQIVAFVRHQNATDQFIFTSRDSGETWTQDPARRLTADDVKMAAGTFSNGAHYVLYTPSVGDGYRSTLAMSVTEIGSSRFSRHYFISKKDQPTTDGAHTASQFHYPDVWEQDGTVYVTASMRAKNTSNGRHNKSIGLARFPLQSIFAE